MGRASEAWLLPGIRANLWYFLRLAVVGAISTAWCFDSHTATLFEAVVLTPVFAVLSTMPTLGGSLNMVYYSSLGTFYGALLNCLVRALCGFHFSPYVGAVEGVGVASNAHQIQHGCS
jgi:hypothetical protein